MPKICGICFCINVWQPVQIVSICGHHDPNHSVTHKNYHQKQHHHWSNNGLHSITWSGFFFFSSNCTWIHLSVLWKWSSTSLGYRNTSPSCLYIGSILPKCHFYPLLLKTEIYLNFWERLINQGERITRLVKRLCEFILKLALWSQITH